MGEGSFGEVCGCGIIFPLDVESGGGAVGREDVVEVFYVSGQVLRGVVGYVEVGAVVDPVVWIGLVWLYSSSFKTRCFVDLTWGEVEAGNGVFV